MHIKKVKMANEPDDFDKNIENLKETVRKSFARIYASLKARELKTSRQLDAIRKQYQNDKGLKRNCVQNINVSYENESTLLENISNYGVINFDKLTFDSSTFTMEDYVRPNEDHMYLYKTIEDHTKNDQEQAIQEAALKEITKTDDCVCFVNIRTEDVSKKFTEINSTLSDNDKYNAIESSNTNMDVSEICLENIEDEKSISSNSSDVDVKKIDPTDDWLNSIKNQTETEPSQVSDVMEHSTIACS